MQWIQLQFKLYVILCHFLGLQRQFFSVDDPHAITHEFIGGYGASLTRSKSLSPTTTSVTLLSISQKHIRFLLKEEIKE